MIRNRSEIDTITKGKEGRTESNTIKTLQADSQKKDSFILKQMAKRLSKIKSSPAHTCKDIQCQK